jgi:hypothetical protein
VSNLIESTPANISGKIEIRAAGVKVPYSTYDKLGAIDQGAIVENKRLSHALRISGLVQAERDNQYYAGVTSRKGPLRTLRACDRYQVGHDPKRAVRCHGFTEFTSSTLLSITAVSQLRHRSEIHRDE